MIRVVFDTNILYSAIRQPKGLPAKAVDLVVLGLVIPCVSDALLDEYRDVLLRRELDLHAERRRLVLDLFASVALHVIPTETLKISNDEDDNRVYECAAEALGGLHRHWQRQPLQETLQDNKNRHRPPAR